MLIMLFCCRIMVARAQSAQIAGTVIDSSTLKPIADASVYIGNTTIGTKTDKDGKFRFVKLSPGNYQLLISNVGYLTRQAELYVDAGEQKITIALKQHNIELNEVTIDASDYKHNLVLFKREFIGTTNPQDCKILNPDILNLSFDYKNNRLIASTDEFLDIENSVLGYKLRFLVKDFSADYNTRRCHYAGTVIFEELPGTKSEQKTWVKSRLETYNNSFRHFLVSLSKAQLDKNKFVVKKLNRTVNPERPADSVIRRKNLFFSAQLNQKRDRSISDSIWKWSKLKALPRVKEDLNRLPLHEDDLLKPNTETGLYSLQFDGYIYVIDKNKNVDLDTDDLHRFDEARAYQIASISLKNPKQPVIFNADGILITKEGLYYEGAWNNRIVDLMPFDYMPDKK